MNRLILSEVKRIHELMGLSSSNLIIESKSALIKDLLGDLVNRAMGAFDKNLIRGLGRISRETFEDRLNQEWLNSPLRDTEAREKIFLMRKMLETIINEITSVMDTGKLANKKLSDIHQ